MAIKTFPRLVHALAVFAFLSAGAAYSQTPPTHLYEGRTCEEVAIRAREIMTGRQGGLTWEGARLYLATDRLSVELVAAAYNIRRYRGGRETLDEILRFGDAWRAHCEAARAE